MARALWLVLVLSVWVPVAWPLETVLTILPLALAGAALALALLSAPASRLGFRPAPGRLMAWLDRGTRALFVLPALFSVYLSLPLLIVLQPVGGAILLAGGGAAILLARRRLPRGLLTWFTPIALGQALVLGTYVDHFRGSDAAECAQVLASPAVRAVLTRDDLERLPGVELAFPYDHAYDPDLDLYVVTLKEQRAGYFSVTDPPGRASNAVIVVGRSDGVVGAVSPIPDVDGASMPQSVVAAPDLGVAATYVVDRAGQHTIRTYAYAPDDLHEVARQTFPMREPNALALVPGSHRLVADFYGGRGLRLWSADLPDLTAPSWTIVDTPLGRPDKMAWSSALGALVVPSHFGGLVVVDPTAGALLGEVWTFDPMSAVAPDDATPGLVYATGYLFGELMSVDLGARAVTRRVRAAWGPRGVALAAAPALVVVLGYTDGELAVHDARTLERLATQPVGGVARVVRYHPEMGRAVVGSSCGLLEVDIARLAGRGR